jgi:monoterpene epsilon-lactone hydrolase
VASRSLRGRFLRRGLTASVNAIRRASGGAPDPSAPVDELEAYALRLRAQVEELGGRWKPPAGVRVTEAEGAPVRALWVVDEVARRGAGGDAAGLDHDPEVVDDAPDPATPDAEVADAEVADAEVAGRDGATPGGADDPVASTRRVILHLHGGAYCLGSPETHRGLAAALSRTARAAVLLPAYRLAPEHRHPAALEDVLATYRWLTDERGVDPGRIVVTGDSAGGGLGALLLVRLRDEGRPLPAAYVGVSPWTDLAATGSSLTDLDGIDPWLSAALVMPAARSYAGDIPLDDPRVSPLYADLRGLPPMLVHVGTDEILFDDAARFVERAREAGVDASLGRFEGMWHVFHIFPGLPEGRAALRELGGFVRRHTDHPRSAGTGSTADGAVA